jgi:pyrroline-5-carboxylate reductase
MNIGFIGAGKMAEALIAGLIARQFAQPRDILASDVSAERLDALREQYHISVTTSNADVPAHADLLVLAVKPQQLDAVLRDIAPVTTGEHLVISIAAGKRTAWLEALLPAGRIVRVMPNIACLVGEGANAYTRGTRATEDDAALVQEVLGCCGLALELPETEFDAVTALSGSGPAFFAWVLDRFVDGAVLEGLPRDQALVLGAQTMLGTARLLLATGAEPANLAASVTSAKGTTAEGRAVLENEAAADLLKRTIQAAARRSRELSQP